MNRKLIGSLLGGGVAITVASLAGIKANESLKQSKQISHFGGIRKQFNKSLIQLDGLQGWTIPKWEDDEIWKERYNAGNNSIYTYEGGDKRRDLANPKELRDACYELITKSKERIENCSASSGWCLTCAFDREWYKGKYKNID